MSRTTTTTTRNGERELRRQLAFPGPSEVCSQNSLARTSERERTAALTQRDICGPDPEIPYFFIAI